MAAFALTTEEHGLLHYARGERWTMTRVIVKDVNILGGEPVFRGTRVPFKILIEYLEGGDSWTNFWRSIQALAANLPSLPSRRQSRVLSRSSNEGARRRVCAKSAKQFLTKQGHRCLTVQEAGWSGKQNGSFWLRPNLNLMC